MSKVKWGVLGTAGIARMATIPAMQQAENCALYAIAGRSAEKAEQFKETFGFEKAYGSYDALLADPEVEAVYIPLPNDLHREWVLRAVNAKKHVLCEKPLALTEKQAEEMFRAAEENGVFLMEAYAYLHSPIIDAFRKELDSGAIGEIRCLESAFLGGVPKENDYRWRREAGGGSQYDLGCYALSMALRMFGREPKEVHALAYYGECGIDLFSSAILTFEDGAIASLDCGMLSGTNRHDRFHVLGTRGEMYSPVAFNQSGEIPYTVVSGGKTDTKTVAVPNNYKLEVEQLGRCIRDGESPHVSRDFSLMVARVQDRILEEIGFWNK